MSAKMFWLRAALGLCFALAFVAWLLSQWHLNTYSKEVGQRLELLVELRKGAIQQYFSTARAELMFWSTNPDILAAQKEFNLLWSNPQAGNISTEIRKSYIENNPDKSNMSALDDAQDDSGYSAVHRRLHPLAKLFVSQRGYYDIFLMSTAGDVYYTVEKENDFGSNLITGPLRDSALAHVFNRAMESGHDEVLISDMQSYAPSGGAPAIFMAKTLKDNDNGVIGVIAFQLPTQKIVEIMGYLQGMAETGETYLVGQDKLMRSNSRFSEEPTVLQQRVDTPVVEKALRGESGVEFIEDYRGVDVLSAYNSLAVGNSLWAVVAEFDEQEIIASAAAERPALAGTLLFIYGLSLWSLWYWRGSHTNPSMGEGDIPDMDIELSDFTDPSGMGAG